LVKRIALLFLFALLLFPSIGRAQEAVRLSTLDIGLWPEHDRPSLLVIYRATLPAEVTLPAKITFSIPIEAGEPTAVAVGVDAASVADVAYQTQVMGEWRDVSFVATAPTSSSNIMTRVCSEMARSDPSNTRGQRITPSMR
jgi:hypothetical protein